MIKVNGTDIVNYPDGYELKDLLMGECNSALLSFVKTPLYVYGKDIDELLKYASDIKKHDTSYDTLYIYSEENEEGDRDLLKTKRF